MELLTLKHTPVVPYKLYNICNKIYYMEFERQYDLCMYFLRCQEFYESDIDIIKNRQFTILDFMDVYSSRYGDGNFTYTTDWSGFNIYSSTLCNVYLLNQILDTNKYDHDMIKIIDLLLFKEMKNDFYIIGGYNQNNLSQKIDTYNHELAHAFYTTNSDYKDDVDFLTENLNGTFKGYLENQLKEYGYDSSVLKDEIQAYLSTGIDVVEEHSNYYNEIKEAYKEIFDFHVGDYEYSKAFGILK